MRQWQAEVFAAYDKMRSHHAPYDIRVGKAVLTVLPNVFSPKYITNSRWFAQQVSRLVQNKRLLEIGTGCGIIAVVCAQKGAQVTATDINPAAIKNTKLNAARCRLPIDVRMGSVFEPVKPSEKFDFIFWNHPFNNWKDNLKDILLKAGFDY